MNDFHPAHRDTARVSWIDRRTGVVWINADGLSSKTSYNLKRYGVRAIASEYSGRVGIPYGPGISEDTLDIFCESACFVVSRLALELHAINTAAQGLLRHLVILQGVQSELSPGDSSEEERLVSEWVNGRGGAA